MKKEKTSPYHIAFSDAAVSIIGSALEKLGFVQDSVEIKEYWSNIYYTKEKYYVQITGSDYPTDYPYCYTISLGLIDNTSPLKSAWRSVALWRMTEVIVPDVKAKEYPLPAVQDLNSSFENAKKDLLKYGADFFNGDLTVFEQAYKNQIQQNGV